MELIGRWLIMYRSVPIRALKVIFKGNAGAAWQNEMRFLRVSTHFRHLGYGQDKDHGW